MLTHKRLNQLLEYDPITGAFYWIIPRGSKARKGDVAGFIRQPKRGQKILKIMVDGKVYSAHRLAFFSMLGYWPFNEVDHINGNSLDNSWVNLRPATRQENQCNQGLIKVNKSGHKGVSWDKRNLKWRASIQFQGKAKNLGRFLKIQDAYQAYCVEAKRLFGEFARV